MTFPRIEAILMLLARVAEVTSEQFARMTGKHTRHRPLGPSQPCLGNLGNGSTEVPRLVPLLSVPPYLRTKCDSARQTASHSHLKIRHLILADPNLHPAVESCASKYHIRVITALFPSNHVRTLLHCQSRLLPVSKTPQPGARKCRQPTTTPVSRM